MWKEWEKKELWRACLLIPQKEKFCWKGIKEMDRLR